MTTHEALQRAIDRAKYYAEQATLNACNHRDLAAKGAEGYSTKAQEASNRAAEYGVEADLLQSLLAQVPK